jgi:hypothetical protein
MNASPLLKRLAAIAILLCAMPMLSQKSPDDAIKRLASIDVFAFGGIGFAGVISKGETDYKFVLSQPPAVAVAAFEQLYAHGNPQGKAYALAGLKKLDPDRFHELISSIDLSKEKVITMHGCILSREYLRAIAAGMEREQP